MIETLLFRSWHGLTSRGRIALYRSLGMRVGQNCRFEKIRLRRPSQIAIGESNALTEGCWLWPEDSAFDGVRIRVGDYNYFNRDVMIDARGLVEIGDNNMFGPGVYIADSNHTMEPRKLGARMPHGAWSSHHRQRVLARRQNHHSLGDRCAVAAGAVVNKSFDAGSVVAVLAKLIRNLDA